MHSAAGCIVLYGGADGKWRELCRLYCILHFSIITITDKLLMDVLRVLKKWGHNLLF